MSRGAGEWLTFVVDSLRASKGRWRQISADTGVPYDTLTKIALSRVSDPRVSNVQALHDYFVAAEPSMSKRVSSSAVDPAAMC
ncbi:Cro/Cl family transcriptional regulator [Burkholderia sp. Cy-637]|nr:Cro/Cl family transcriptional regulator [Burkholderia sp. Cy-637]